MAYKIGFHGGPGGNLNGIGEYFSRLDAAGIPAILKMADNYGPCGELVTLAVQSQVPHVIVFRLTTQGTGSQVPGGYDFDVPDYSLPPADAAQLHYDVTKAYLPPEFNKNHVWLEPINEVDKNRANWLGEFAVHFATLAHAEGYRVTMFGWSSGEPEPGHWLLPGMVAYLQLCATYPLMTAVSLHEYSYNVNDISDGFPNRIGRFIYLFNACDQLGIARPTVHITEWGWTHDEIPEDVNAAMLDASWAHSLYDVPEIPGAATWYLGPGFGEIADQVQRLIQPTTEMALLIGPDPSPPDPPDPPPSGWEMVQEQWFNTTNEDGQGWYDQNGVQQVPAGMFLDMATGHNGLGNPDGTEPWNDWRVFEALFRWDAWIPPDEHDWFLNEKGFCYKMFAMSRAWAARLGWLAIGEPGRYRVELEYVDDCYTDIVNGEKVPPTDPLSMEVAIGHCDGSEDFDAESADGWVSLGFLSQNNYAVEFDVEDDNEMVWVAFRARWAISNPAVFIKRIAVYRWAEEPVAGDCRGAPREQYGRTYILLPQAYGTEWGLAAIGATWNKYGFTVGKSADDAGIGDLDRRRVLAVNPGAWGSNGALLDFFAEYYPGVVMESIIADTPYEMANILKDYDDPPSPPELEFRLGAPMEGAAVLTSRFDEPRDYDGDGSYEQRHEGVDFAPRLPGTVHALAAYDGRVIRVRNNQTGYGTYVVIVHEHDTGTYETWYAHLAVAMVSVDDWVLQGQKIGIVGSTGFSDGRHLHLNLVHRGMGSGDWDYVVPDVVDPLPYLDWDWETLPPAGNALLGLHATADGGYSQEEIGVFTTSLSDVIKVLSSTDPAMVSALAAARPNAKWVVRAFLSFGGRVVTPQQFVDWTISDVVRTVNAIGNGRQISIELHNEPNLNAEGLSFSWDNGHGFGEWLKDVILLYRNAFNLPMVFPGVSPGFAVPDVRQDSWQFLDEARSAIDMCDELGVHIYWNTLPGSQYPMSVGLAELDRYIGMFPNKKIWVTEASNNKEDDPINKGEQYIRFWRELRLRPSVQGVTYFVASASDPAFFDEVWLGTAIGEIVGNR